MDLQEYRDRGAFVAAVNAAVAVDPIGNTLLATMLDGGSAGDDLWCAVDPHRPGLAAVRSAAQFPVVLTPGWTAADAPALAGVVSALPGLRGVSGEVELASAVADAVGVRTGREPGDLRPERLYRVDELNEPDGVPGSSRTAGPADRALLTDWVLAFTEEVHAPLGRPGLIVDRLTDPDHALARLWLDPSGRPVSLAGRRSVISGAARIGPVFTPPDERGHRYAAAVTAVLSREILDEGAVPVLFTNAADPVANRLYQRLGYRPVRELARILFR